MLPTDRLQAEPSLFTGIGPIPAMTHRAGSASRAHVIAILTFKPRLRPAALRPCVCAYASNASRHRHHNAHGVINGRAAFASQVRDVPVMMDSFVQFLEKCELQQRQS